MGAFFRIASIILQFITAVVVIFSVFFWQAIGNVLLYIRTLFTKYISNLWLVVIVLSFVSFALLVVASTFQVPVIQFLDEFYTCILIRGLQFVYSFTWTVFRGTVDFLLIRYNDAVLVGVDCLNNTVNMLRILPSIDNVQFYTDIIRAVYIFFECLVLVPFNTASWTIPFGITGLLSSFVRLNLCVTGVLLNIFLGVVEYTIVRNDAQFCAYDPNANCILRQLPPDFVPHFPPTLIGAECTMGRELDCEMIACTLIGFSNFTEPIQVFTGVDLEQIFIDITPSACCLITTWYKPPFWLATGLLSGCINPFDALDFLIDNFFLRLADCFNEFISILSNGIVDNALEIFFRILFPFIQDIIDSVDFFYQCSALQASCFLSYPGNCQIGNDGFATGGLVTCFDGLGECVVNGNNVFGIPPNPILMLQPFASLFQIAFPLIAQLIDSVLCQFIPIQICIFGPSEPFLPSLPDCGTLSFLTWPAVFRCFARCIEQRVPVLFPFAIAARFTLGLIESALNLIFGFIGELFEIVEEVCNVLDSVPGVSLPCPSIPNIPSMREERGYNNTTNGRYHTLQDMINDQNITADTTCGSIIHKASKLDLDFDDMAVGMIYRICLSLLAVGHKYHMKYPDRIDTNRFLNATTFISEFQEILMCKAENEFEDMSVANKMMEQRMMLDESYRKMQKERARPRNFLSKVQGFRREVLDQSELFQMEEYIGNRTESEMWNHYYEIAPIKPTNVGNFLLEWIQKNSLYQVFQPSVEHLMTIYALNKKYRRTGSLLELNDNNLNMSIAQFFDETLDSSQLQEYQISHPVEVPYPEPSTPFQQELNTVYLKKHHDDWIAVTFSMVRNRIMLIRDEARAIRIAKEEFRKGVNEKKTGCLTCNNAISLSVYLKLQEDGYIEKEDEKVVLKRAYELFNQPGFQTTPKYYTRDELKTKSDNFYAYFDRLNSGFKYLHRATSQLSTSEEITMADSIAKSSVYRDTIVGKTYNMMMHEDKSSFSKMIDNTFKTIAGVSNYDTEKGFISKEEFDQLERDREEENPITVWNIINGKYNPRRRRVTGFLFSNPDNEWISFHQMKKSWHRNIANEHVRMMNVERKKGNIPNMTQEFIENFKITSAITATSSNFAIDILEWVVNNLLSTISDIFFNETFSIDLNDIILSWLDSFDVVDITTNAVNSLIDYVRDIFRCTRPDDYTTRPYRIGCFPNFPQNVLSTWAVPIGFGNRYFPLQLGVAPTELITQDCVNTFNGEPNFFMYRESNNCPVMDGQNRPRCNLPFPLQCDYCQREYQTCTEFGFDSLEDSIGFISGIIPVLLQEFYTGVIPSSEIQIFFTFFTIFVLNFGGFQAFFFPYIAAPAIALSYLVTNILDSTFTGFAGAGEEGGIPFGAIYIVILLLIQLFAGWIFDAFPTFIVILIGYGLAASWVIALFYTDPFRNIQRDFRLSFWFGQATEFLENTPQPLLAIPWGSFIEAFDQYDYSRQSVPYVDVFCFTLTSYNLILAGIAVFVLIDIIQGLFTIAYPIWLALIALFNRALLTFNQILNVILKQRVSDLEENQENIKQSFNSKIRAIYNTMKFKDNFTMKIDVDENDEDRLYVVNSKMKEYIMKRDREVYKTVKKLFITDE